MARFVVRQPVAAPPDFVAAWWTDFREDDARLGGQMEGRKVRKIDATHVQVDSNLRVGKRAIRVDGIVTLEGPRVWSIQGDLYVEGKLFGKEFVRYHVDPAERGSSVTGEFTFTGKDLLHRLILLLANRSARKGREDAFRGFAAAIAKDLSDRSDPGSREATGGP
jgi:hypothetical protein